MKDSTFDFFAAREALDQIIQREEPFDQRAELALELAEELLDVENVHLTRIDVEKGFWKSIVSTDPSDGRFPAGVILDLEDTYCDNTVTEGIHLATASQASTDGLGTYLGVRIGGAEDPFGTLCFVCEEERNKPFEEVEVAFAEIIAQRLENELIRELSEERVDYLEQCARTISHDLRNPLGVAMGHLELASADGANPHLEAIEQSLARMETIVEDVLVWARESRSIDHTTDVELFELAVTAWASVETADASLELGEDLTFQADRDRTLRLFENIYRNAIEHGGANVTIHVDTLEVADGFFIADDGPGIPSDQHDEIFVAGHSTKSNGTGLGMAIVRAIAEAHGWQVDLDQEFDEGVKLDVRDVIIDPELA